MSDEIAAVIINLSSDPQVTYLKKDPSTPLAVYYGSGRGGKMNHDGFIPVAQSVCITRYSFANNLSPDMPLRDIAEENRQMAVVNAYLESRIFDTFIAPNPAEYRECKDASDISTVLKARLENTMLITGVELSDDTRTNLDTAVDMIDSDDVYLLFHPKRAPAF